MKLLQTVVEQSLESVLADLGLPDTWKSALGPSREKDQGDITLPCFMFAKQLSKNPVQIAEEISNLVSGDFEVSSSGGYLNFKANPEWLVKNVFLSRDLSESKIC